MDEIYNDDGSINRDKWLDFVVRPARNTALIAADARIRRYDLQIRAKISPIETAEKITELLVYMQDLRDLPSVVQPENFAMPEVP